MIRDAGRVPAQRDTLYRILRSYPASPSTNERDPLDEIRDGDTRFGSYRALTDDERYRFKERATRPV